MAEEERLTKAERRTQARAERKRKEEEARKQAQRKRMINTVATFAVIVVVGIILIPTIQNLTGGDGDSQVEITLAAAQAASQDAGCVTTVEDTPLPGEPTHWSPAEAPSADALYGTEVRPTHSGSHFGDTVGPVFGTSRTALDERGTTHNLEHGAVIVWYDESALDSGAIGAIEGWQQDRSDLGFGSSGSQGSLLASPYDGTFTSGKPIALRGWGNAVDCDTFDETVADAFLIDHFGTHGIAPERNLTPYPDGTLGYTDAAVEDNTDAPTTDRHGSEEASDHDDATDDASDHDDATDDASETATDDASETTSEG